MVRILVALTTLVVCFGCESSSPISPAYFTCDESIGCQSGYTCDSEQRRCVPIMDVDQGSRIDVDLTFRDAGTMGESDAAADGDGDGIADGNDNCPDQANPEQRDGDNDGLGDVCDAEADKANFQLGGQFLIFGGRLVDDTHTLQGGGFTAHGVVSDGEFQLRGGLQP